MLLVCGVHVCACAYSCRSRAVLHAPLPSPPPHSPSTSHPPSHPPAPQVAARRADAERETKRRERLEREMRDARASLEARAGEVRDRQLAAQQAVEHAAKLQVGGWLGIGQGGGGEVPWDGRGQGWTSAGVVRQPSLPLPTTPTCHPPGCAARVPGSQRAHGQGVERVKRAHRAPAPHAAGAGTGAQRARLHSHPFMCVPACPLACARCRGGRAHPGCRPPVSPPVSTSALPPPRPLDTIGVCQHSAAG